MLSENFIEYIESSIKENWELPALSDYKGKCFKYKDIARKIVRIHIMFEECDVKKGDKIALISKNSANWGMTYLAIITYGAVVVPILPDFLPNDVHHIVNHSDSVVLFSGDPIWENLNEESMPNLRAIFSLNDFRLLIEGNRENIQKKYNKLDEIYAKKYPNGLSAKSFNIQKISNKEVGVLNYTSGTTGFSKGVVLPLNSLAANIRFAINNMPLKSGDNIVSFLPLAHTYGCAFEFLWPFTIGCHIHFLTRTPSPKIIIQAYKEIRPNLILSVPLIMEKMYKKQILPALNKQSLKLMLKVPLLNKTILNKIRAKLVDSFGGNFHEIVIGGAALNKEVEDFLHKIKFPFSIGYGMTECGPLISYSNWDITKLGSSGSMVDTLDIKIDSEDPYNVVGEIMVKGENLFYGYYKNKEATEHVLAKDGWFHTGDLGIIDKENFVFIKGRSKSLLLGASGENIYPEEIEAKLNNFQYIQESVVIQKGTQLIALVHPDYDSVDKDKISEKKLLELLEKNKHLTNQTFPKHMQLSKIELYPEEFAKTPKQNIKRYLYTAKDY